MVKGPPTPADWRRKAGRARACQRQKSTTWVSGHLLTHPRVTACIGTYKRSPHHLRAETTRSCLCRPRGPCMSPKLNKKLANFPKLQSGRTHDSKFQVPSSNPRDPVRSPFGASLLARSRLAAPVWQTPWPRAALRLCSDCRCGEGPRSPCSRRLRWVCMHS
jgi:hypothetical protein